MIDKQLKRKRYVSGFRDANILFLILSIISFFVFIFFPSLNSDYTAFQIRIVTLAIAAGIHICMIIDRDASAITIYMPIIAVPRARGRDSRVRSGVG